MQQFTIALVRVTYSGYITIYINGISQLTFSIIHNVLYLEYNPQNDAGTLLNKTKEILTLQGFTLMKKKICFLVEFDRRRGRTVIIYDVITYNHHKLFKKELDLN